MISLERKYSRRHLLIEADMKIRSWTKYLEYRNTWTAESHPKLKRENLNGIVNGQLWYLDMIIDFSFFLYSIIKL